MWDDARWLNALIGALHAIQLAGLKGLAWLGLLEMRHGQPAWPWAWRLSGENLLIDAGQARRLGGTVIVLVLIAALLLVAMWWQRRRAWVLATVPLLLLVAPWPEAQVVWVAATPASFHKPPNGATVQSIVRGRALYAQHCVACHGTDGRGQGPLAAAQTVWPPNLTGPLLWRRADGDLLWHVLHGVRDRHGVPSMPAFGGRLRDDEGWALIDFLKAQAAGETLRATGVWALPAALPDAVVRCGSGPDRSLASWRGQRIRIVAASDARAVSPLEDPRFVTVWLRPAADPLAAAPAGCALDDADAWVVFSLLAGTSALAGSEFIADRGGWLRALGRPGQVGWSDDDLLCRTETKPRGVASAPSADGLEALIRRMDAEPVRFVKGGFVH